jgi:hypothetical protein
VPASRQRTGRQPLPSCRRPPPPRRDSLLAPCHCSLDQQLLQQQPAATSHLNRRQLRPLAHRSIVTELYYQAQFV